MHWTRLLALPLCCALAAQAAEPIRVPVDAATLSTLPRVSVSANAHGHALHCEGVALAALLRRAGTMPATPLHGRQLARYVRVNARDDYRVVFSLAELDPSLGNTRVYLVDRCDGKPLDAEHGPLRLIAPDEDRPARWVRQVRSISVVEAP